MKPTAGCSLDELVVFWQLVSRLKDEPRRGWVKKLRLQRTESVADHSFALSMLCLLEGEKRGYDIEKLLKLALLHDLEEAITGDLTPEDKEAIGEPAAKDQKRSARELLLSGFPGNTTRTYLELWAELENQQTKEARLVHELDKLEMTLQANQYAQHGIERAKLEEFFETSRATIKDERLRRILDEVDTKNRK